MAPPPNSQDVKTLNRMLSSLNQGIRMLAKSIDQNTAAMNRISDDLAEVETVKEETPDGAV